MNDQEILADRPDLFAGKPAPTTGYVKPPICGHHMTNVGAGLPANTVAAATVNDQEVLAGRPGLFAGKPAPTTGYVKPPTCGHRRPM